MSHSVRLAEALARTTKRYESRSVGAPGATVNWSYGAFQRDDQPPEGKVAVLSLMTANAPMVTTMTAMTWNSAFPMPYTADRYRLQQSELRAVPLPFESFPAYVAAFKDPRRWAAARQAFKENDAYYNDLMFRASVLDHSASFRLIRRAYGLHLERAGRARVMDQKQFRSGTEELSLLNAIVRSFADKARQKGVLPVVYIVNNYGYSTMLYDALAGTLTTCGIPHLSSHTVVSPSDPRGYLPDSHFTDSNDDRLARALERLIDRELKSARPAGDRLLGRARRLVVMRAVLDGLGNDHGRHFDRFSLCRRVAFGLSGVVLHSRKQAIKFHGITLYVVNGGWIHSQSQSDLLGRRQQL